MRGLLAAGLGVAVACSSSGSTRQAPEGRDAAVAPGSVQAAVAIDAGPVSEPLPFVAGVAPLTAAAAGRARAPEADRLNAEALALHRAGKLAEAIAIYKRALAVDAGHLLARYNLACALVRIGKPRYGLALLASFQNIDCGGCRERLVRARADDEWKTLWGDPEFEAIAALPAADSHVEIAHVDPRLPAAVRKPGFVLRPRLMLDREVGFARVPPFALVVSGPRGVTRAPFDLANRRGEVVVGRVRISGVGRYSARIAAGERVYWSTRFDVARRWCFGEPVSYVVDSAHVGFAAPVEYGGGDETVIVGKRFVDPAEEDAGPVDLATLDDRDHPVVKLDWRHTWPGDGVGSVVIAWRHEGKTIRVGSQSIAPARLEPGACPIAPASIELTPPASLELRPGRWTVGLYTERDGGVEIDFELTRGADVIETPITERRLTAVPAWAAALVAEEAGDALPEVWDGTGKPMSRRLIRAALRSDKLFAELVAARAATSIDPARRDALLARAAQHGQPWKPAELALPPGVAPPLAPVDPPRVKMGKRLCAATACPSYPAISPDGKVLVTRDEEVITYWDQTEPCGHPVGDFVRYRALPSMKSIASVDMTGFKPLGCGARMRLAPGFKARMVDNGADMDLLQVVDRAGKVVAREEGGAPHRDHCANPDVRIVVIRDGESATHCNEHADFGYDALTY